MGELHLNQPDMRAHETRSVRSPFLRVKSARSLMHMRDEKCGTPGLSLPDSFALLPAVLLDATAGPLVTQRGHDGPAHHNCRRCSAAASCMLLMDPPLSPYEPTANYVVCAPRLMSRNCSASPATSDGAPFLTLTSTNSAGLFTASEKPPTETEVQRQTATRRGAPPPCSSRRTRQPSPSRRSLHSG